MKALMKRAGTLTLVAAMVVVPGLAAIGVCAQYISSGAGDRPMTGWLLGDRTQTETTLWSYTTSWLFKFFGGAFTYSGSRARSFSVGTYYMSNNTLAHVRCDGYRLL